MFGMATDEESAGLLKKNRQQTHEPSVLGYLRSAIIAGVVCTCMQPIFKTIINLVLFFIRYRKSILGT